jgi:putative membrane protein
MAIGELRRITAGRLPRIAVLALSIIPLLYGGLYL